MWSLVGRGGFSFLIGCYGLSRLFHSFSAMSILGEAKTGDPRENHLTTHKQNLACLACAPRLVQVSYLNIFSFPPFLL